MDLSFVLENEFQQVGMWVEMKRTSNRKYVTTSEMRVNKAEREELLGIQEKEKERFKSPPPHVNWKHGEDGAAAASQGAGEFLVSNWTLPSSRIPFFSPSAFGPDHPAAATLSSSSSLRPVSPSPNAVRPPHSPLSPASSPAILKKDAAPQMHITMYYRSFSTPVKKETEDIRDVYGFEVGVCACACACACLHVASF